MVLIGEERQGEEHGGFGKTSTAVKTVVRLQTCYRALGSPKLRVRLTLILLPFRPACSSLKH